MLYRNLLFASVGDKTDFYKHWCKKHKNYDIYLCYYGTSDTNKYMEYSDLYCKRKGSKFQNFYHIWMSDKNIQNYDRYFLLDDDILLDTKDINDMFEISKKHDLWICQPSFDSSNNNAIINHQITKSEYNCILRYVNFVEVNTMLFNNYAISQLMSVYDNSLVGWGIDWLAIWCLGKDVNNKYAIIDCIKTINPKIRTWMTGVDVNKTDIKEIDVLQDKRDRFKAWYWYSKKNNIKEWQHKVYSSIKI